MYNNDFIDINGKKRGFLYYVRDNGKKVQVRCGLFKAEATCCKDNTFDFDKGLVLAEKRLMVKLLNNQVNEIAKSM